MDRVFSEAKKLEQERLKQGKEPNPSLTSPEEAKKYGWEINGRDVKRIKSMDGEISTKAINKAISEMLKTLEHEEKGGPGRGPRPGGGSGSKKPASLDDVRSKAKKLFSSKTNDKKAFDQLVEEFEERGIDVGDISNIMDEIGFKSSY